MTFNFMASVLRLFAGALGAAFALGRRRFGSGFFRTGRRSADQRCRERQVLGLRPLHRIAYQHVAALRAGNRPLDQDQARLLVRRHDPQVLCRHADVAHVAGHLLALEHLARILVLPRGAVAAMTDGHDVRGAKAGPIVTINDDGSPFPVPTAGPVAVTARAHWARHLPTPTPE